MNASSGLLTFAFYRDWGAYAKEISDVLDHSTIAVFLVLGVTLFTVGCCLLVRIKTHYPQLHKQHGCILWLALFLLSVPLCMRAIIDYVLRGFEPEGGDLAAYNIALFLVTDYLPIVF